MQEFIRLGLQCIQHPLHDHIRLSFTFVLKFIWFNDINSTKIKYFPKFLLWTINSKRKNPKSIHIRKLPNIIVLKPNSFASNGYFFLLQTNHGIIKNVQSDLWIEDYLDYHLSVSLCNVKKTFSHIFRLISERYFTFNSTNGAMVFYVPI